MRRSLTALLTVLFLGLDLQAYPVIETNPSTVRPNAWTKQLPTAKLRASQQGLPVLVAIVDSVTCSLCKSFDQLVLQQGSWSSFISQYPMFLVMLDRSKLTSAEWQSLPAPYRSGSGGLDFPTIAVHAPNGTKLTQFVATGGYGANPGFNNKVLSVIEPYYSPGTIGFTAAAQTVSEDSGTVTVTVSRQDGKARAQSFTYTTANGTATAGTDYDAVSGTLTWGNGDTANKSFAVPLLNDDRWKAPRLRDFTVTLTRAAGSDADLGTMTQTVTIEEAEPLVPGTLGFLTADGGHFREGAAYTGLVARTHGALGQVGVNLYADAGYTVAPTELTWADSNSVDQVFTLTINTVTPEYDPPRDMTVILFSPTGDATLGLATQTVTVLDQQVSKTFEEYTAGRPLYQHLSQESGFWFYNDVLDALRTEPLEDGAQAVLIWTAPAAGRLTFTWWDNRGNSPDPAQTVTGTCQCEAGVESLDLPAAQTNNNTVAVNAGDVIRWTATGVTNYVFHLTDLAWEGLTPPGSAGVAPAPESVIQIDHVRADTNLVDLVWQAGAGNPADITQRLYAGPAANALAEVVPAGGVASGLNAVGEGIVNLAAAQGWVYWRVDSEVSGDIGTGSAEGTVWRFAIVELPVFQAGAPAAGQTWSAYLKAGTSLPLTAASTTPVTYAAFGLPDGMAIDSQTGVLSGTPKRGGTYNVTVRATNQAGSTDLSFVIDVKKLPDFASTAKIPGFLLERTTAPATGQIYEGVVSGTVDFQSRSSGKLSARLDIGGRRQSLTGTWVVEGLDASRLTAVLDNRKGDILEMELASDGILSGVYNDGALLLGRAFDPAASVYEGYYTAALPTRVLMTVSAAIDNRPEGYGYLTLTVRKKGQVKYAGQLADGQRLNGSSSLMVFNGAEMRAMGYDVAGNGSFALFPLYKALYGRRGNASAMFWIEARDPASAEDNLVWIENTQWSYPGKSARLTADGFLAVFEWEPRLVAPVFGQAHICGAFFVKRQDFTNPYNGAMFLAAGQALPVTVTTKALSLEKENALSAKLKASNSKGLLSGSFQQADPTTGRATKFKFKGVLVNLQGVGLGYGAYQELDPAAGDYRLKRSKAVKID